MKKVLKWALVAVVSVLVLVQFFRPNRENPPLEPSLALTSVAQIGPGVAVLLRTSCYDCHSNETRWPWYSGIAPASWLVAQDVAGGRRHLNFSEWGKYSPTRQISLLGKISDEVSSRGMPLPKYLMLHADARLTPADADSIVHWADGEQDRIFSQQAKGDQE